MKAGADRAGRLSGLTRAWSHLYLFHPGLAVPDERWEAALEAVIPMVERADSPDALAAAMNDGLIELLHDRWTAVFSAGEAREPDEPHGSPIEAAMLADGIGYIRCSSADAFDLPAYPLLMSSAIDTVKDADGVVLDLRWGRRPRPWPNLHRRPRFSTDDCWPSCVLGFFLEEAIPTPARWERVHTGWSEEGWSHYGESLILRAGEPLQPIVHPPFFVEQRYSGVRLDRLTTYNGRLAVLVDDHAIGWLDHGLAALQQAGRGLVVHETYGAPRHRSEPLAVVEGVALRTRPYRLDAELSPARTLQACRDRDAAIAAARVLLEAPDSVAEAELVGPTATRRPVPGRGAIRTLSREGRLHGLLKTWAVLSEFFPHAELADVDWDEGLGEWIRRVEEAEDTVAYYGVLLEFAARLNDSHSGTPGVDHPAVDHIRGTHTPPIRIAPVERGVAVIEVHDASLQRKVPLGAAVSHVDGRPVAEIARERARLRSASTSQALDHWLYESGGVLAGPRDSEVSITLGRPPDQRVVTARRTLENWYWLVNPRPTSERLRDRFGYINLTRVQTPTDFDQVLESMSDTDGLVLDIRGYPGFFLQSECVSRLIDRPIASPTFLVPVRSAADRHGWHVSSYQIVPRGPFRYRAPVVVLIDAGTISSAEDFCLCLRPTGRVTFVGRPTAGTDGNITNLHLPGGGRFWFSGMRVLDAEGRPFQNIGIEPDVVVPRTVAGVVAAHDEILEAAMDLLAEQADQVVQAD